jgi:hypothetical protein
VQPVAQEVGLARADWQEADHAPPTTRLLRLKNLRECAKT